MGRALAVLVLALLPATPSDVAVPQDAPEVVESYFPELKPFRADEPPASAHSMLRVALPATEAGPVEISVAGVVFRVYVPSARGEPRRLTQGRAVYGQDHVWSPAGRVFASSDGVDAIWLADRVEEYFVVRGRAADWTTHYRVELPPEVRAVRNAGDYLELLAGDVPILRFHLPVARDAGGRQRVGSVRVSGAGVDFESKGRAQRPVRYTLDGRELILDASIDLTALRPPVVVDPGWSSTTSLALARSRHTATLLTDGRVLVAAGSGSPPNSEIYDPATGVWSAAAPLVVGRTLHTATLLRNGKVLVAGGSTAETDVELYDPVADSWTVGNPLSVGHARHSAILLASGTVLVIGGGSPAVANVEVFDPGPGTWTNANPMGTARNILATTQLADGRVLATAGSNPGYLATTEIYDPATGNWTPAGSLSGSRDTHNSVLLPSGKVLVTAGTGAISGPNANRKTCPIYDPVTGLWTLTGDLTTGRYGHTTTLLPNGKVLVVAGVVSGSAISSAEIYDPAAGTWASAGNLAQARYTHTATLLPSGKVLVAGGLTGTTDLATVELYDPTGTWSGTGALQTARASHTATLLPSAKVLVAGGAGAAASADLYDPAAGTWSATASMATARQDHTATPLVLGPVLVAGGHDGTQVTGSAELYYRGAATWASVGSLGTPRRYHTATLLPSQRVLIAGGDASGGPTASAELFDPGGQTFSPTGGLATPRRAHTASLLPNGKVLVAGGRDAGGPFLSAELYDPSTGVWASTGPMATARSSHIAMLLPSGKVLVAGGVTTGGAETPTAELYDPAAGTWATTGPLAGARAFHSATLHPSGLLVVAGGYSGATPMSSTEIYDPARATWTTGPVLGTARGAHTATFLTTGRILVAGGGSPPTTSAELLALDGAADATRPQISGACTSPCTTNILRGGAGTAFTVSGTRLRGISGASNGSVNDSSSDFPILRLVALDGSRVHDARATSWSATSVSGVVPNAPPGSYLLSAVVNGIDPGQVVQLEAAVPLAAPVRLDARAGNGAVVVSWTSDTEERIVEYGLFRSVGPAGIFEALADPVPAQQPFSAVGASYRRDDAGLENGTTYYYRLDVRGPGGEVSSVGPVGATPGVREPSGCGCQPAGGAVGVSGLVLLLGSVGDFWRRRRRSGREPSVHRPLT